ncbi:MAG: OmpH family outer membrane protein [Bacteroidetes bacterium]|nr:OmpH family outer membrane protein [Bacteroidota bacterium]
MKNLSIALNVVMAIAVGILYFLHFSSSTPNNAQADNEESVVTEGEMQEMVSAIKADSRVYYVNSDSLYGNFQMMKKLEEDLLAEKKKVEGQFKAKVTAFENEYMDLQSRAEKGLLTSAEAQKKEAALINQEKNLKLLQEKLTNDLYDKEDEVKNKIQDYIYNYLKKYQQENGMDFILGYTRAGGPVLYGNEALDITNEVVSGLNRDYEKQTAKKAEKK